jgi:ribosomal protein L29
MDFPSIDIPSFRQYIQKESLEELHVRLTKLDKDLAKEQFDKIMDGVDINDSHLP